MGIQSIQEKQFTKVGFETALSFILDLLVKNKPLAAISLLYGLIELDFAI